MAAYKKNVGNYLNMMVLILNVINVKNKEVKNMGKKSRYRVFSKGKTASTWIVERTFVWKLPATAMAKRIKASGRLVKVVKV